MSIKIKAVERNISFDKSKEKWAYVMKPELYSRLSSNKVIKAWATEGHSVEVPGLGTMRFGIRAASVDDVNNMSTKFITTRRVGAASCTLNG